MKSNNTILAKIRKGKIGKFLAAFIAINLLSQIVSPSIAMALTAGAAAPEFSSFEPVATTDMVNDFTGDFTYNLPVISVPGPDGAGYSMSLSYHSGASSEEEASWVGFGWSLNPGAINRQKRGFPDDFNNITVENYNKIKPNWTQTAKFDFNMEFSSNDKKPKSEPAPEKALAKIMAKLGLQGMGQQSNGANGQSDPADISLSVSHTIRYNNYSGFSIANSFGLGVKGMANLNMNRSGGENKFGFSVNPMAIMKAITKNKNKDNKVKSEKKWFKIKKLTVNKPKFKNNLGTASYSFQSFNAPALSYSVAEHAGAAWNFSGSVEVNPYGPIGFQVGIAGSLNAFANKANQTCSAYGYMYSGENNNSSSINVLHDYQIEKESTFNKHDKNLGIPFNNADLFSATGNGVVGGFRIYQDKIGQYYPNYTESKVRMSQIGVELGIGGTLQIGFDIGVGFQKTKVDGSWKTITYPEFDQAAFFAAYPATEEHYNTWFAAQQTSTDPNFDKFINDQFTSTIDVNNYNTFNSSKIIYSSNPNPKMRFTNDPGGEVDYSDITTGDSDPMHATIGSGKALDLSNFNLNMVSEKAQSSSNISYTKDGSLINGIQVTNKDGGISEYNQPVMVKNEAELTVGLDNNIDGYPLAYQALNYDQPLYNKTVIGQKTTQAYASTYLLTANTTFDYVDLDASTPLSATHGPSPDDFGGWTKFGYRKSWGGTNEWYRYRAPYTGLNYENGRISDRRDQTGSMSSGEKEVYYLKAIETKTHIAFFVTNKSTPADFADYGIPASAYSQITGSGAERFDGLDAAAIIQSGVDAGQDPAALHSNAHGTHHLEKLEKIVLYSKSDYSKPLSTTYFDYDYSVCQGIPNNDNYNNSTMPTTTKGKLTLKKVWTESGGVIRSKIAPYQFHYQYFNNYPVEIKNEYPSWANLVTNPILENPIYHPEQLDCWGFYQENGAIRFKNMQHWVSQKKTLATFDPAAWQLKRIQLPSGGEIHIQYEQSDYKYVQDKEAMAMVSLTDGGQDDTYESDNNKYFINHNDIDVDVNLDPNALDKYRAKLESYFIGSQNKLYYKALYAFEDEFEPYLNDSNSGSEYITGYTTVNEVGIENGKIYLKLGEVKEHGGIDGDTGKKDKTLPRYVCYQNLLNMGGKNLGHDAFDSQGWEADDNSYVLQVYPLGTNPGETAMKNDLAAIARQNVLGNTIDMFKEWVNGDIKNTRKKDACKAMNFDLSYFKLPVYHAKKGGGIRVKRLLSYDPGIAGENGDAMVYGSEYLYNSEDGSSSGVATNEPPSIREENALVVLKERTKQKWIDKTMNGRDTKEFEGPIGENLLPSASVVYERVVIKNIHSGNTTTGFMVNKYHTVKEYPMEVTQTSIDKKYHTYKKFNLSLPLGLFNMEVHKAWVTQGYEFKLNDMHGKLESQASYSGNYNPSSFNSSAFTSKTAYHYSTPGEKIRTLLYNRSTMTMQEAMLNPGTEEDFTMFMSNVTEKINDFSVELDLNFTFPTPSLSFGFGLSYSLTDNQLCQHVTSKVISQKTYLLSTTNTTDGVTQTTQNLAFDKYTGDPVLTSTYDGYIAPDEKVYSETDNTSQHDGHYYALNIPASWVYPTMGRKSENDTYTNQLTASTGSIVTYGTNELYNAVKGLGESETWSATGAELINVVSASSTVYKNNWFPSSISSVVGVVPKLNSHYYPYRSYVYRDEVKNANDQANKIYGGGVMSSSFNFFNWGLPVSYFSQHQIGKWYSPTEVVAYSPYGYPIEEIDVLGIRSTAKFGYFNTLPILVAQNAAYNEVQFFDFEDRNYDYTGDSNFNQDFAHSGYRSYDLSQNHSKVFVDDYIISNEMISTKGLSIKLWLKSSLSDVITSPNYGLKNPNPQLKANVGGQYFDFKRIAQTGDWSLYTADIKNFIGLTAGTYDIELSYNYLNANEKVLVDDFRIQPLDAQMNCTVYTADNKVAAQFDDQHYGVYYEYNNKGQLVRKSVETERGKKTLQEQQYNTPLINRN